LFGHEKQFESTGRATATWLARYDTIVEVNVNSKLSVARNKTV